MTFRSDTRGQAIQVGAVLLFAALITAYATYQAVVVPQQNRQVEFDHSQQVQGDLLDLRNAIVSPRSGGDSVSVRLGTQYPSRALLLNPSPPSGSLRTVDTGNASRNLTVRNATASGEVRDFWNGTSHRYPTGAFVYQPEYNEYRGVETYYENTVLYNQGPGATVPLSGQRLVDDEDLTLVTFNGSLSRGRSASVGVDVRPVSFSETTVAVGNDTSNVTVSFPTRLPRDQWRTLLDGEFVDQGGHVTRIRNRSLGRGVDLLSVDLESGVEYDLRMLKVGFGTNLRAAETGYIVPVAGNESTVPEGGTQRVVFEVRDRYNNPVDGVEVNASVSLPGASVSPTRQETDGEGRLSVTYNATDVDISGVAQRTETLNVSFDAPQSALDTPGFDRRAPENATVELAVRNADDSGLGGGGGGVGGDLTYDGGAVAYDGQDFGTVPGGVNASFTNEFGQDITVTDIRVVPQNPSIDGLDDTVGTNTPPAPGRNELFVRSDVQDGYVDINGGYDLPTTIDVDDDGFLNNGNPVVSAGSSLTVYLYEFYDGATNVNMDGETVEITLSYRLENGLTGEKTYTVTPTASGGGGGGNTAPSVTIDSVTETSTGPRTADVQVDFTGSDPDGNLDSYTVELYDSSSKTDQLDSASSTSYTGGSQTVTVSDTDSANQPDAGSSPYYVVVTVTDTQGASDTAEQST